jgi:predicted N-formylglutamate amidohydrolase
MLYGRDRRLAAHFLEELAREPDLVAGDNEPYRVTDAGDYTVPVHGERRGLHSVLIEIRQDHVQTEAGARAWAERLALLYRRIEPRLGLSP